MENKKKYIKIAQEQGIEGVVQEAQKELFDKFDKYSCIKNDKWYLDYKKEVLKH